MLALASSSPNEVRKTSMGLKFHARRLVIMARLSRGAVMEAQEFLDGLLIGLNDFSSPQLTAWAFTTFGLVHFKVFGAVSQPPLGMLRVHTDLDCAVHLAGKGLLSGTFSPDLRVLRNKPFGWWTGDALEASVYCALLDRSNPSQKNDIAEQLRAFVRFAQFHRSFLPAALRVTAIVEGSRGKTHRGRLEVASAKLIAIRYGNPLEQRLCDLVECAMTFTACANAADENVARQFQRIMGI